MKINVTNLIDECPPCKDAAVTIEHDINTNDHGEEEYVNLVMDCEHSGVCANKGCNAYSAIASKFSVSPIEIISLEDALRGAVKMAHVLRPGEEKETLYAISCLIPAGVSVHDAQLLARKIACYGNVDTWLEARDEKKEFEHDEE